MLHGIDSEKTNRRLIGYCCPLKSASYHKPSFSEKSGLAMVRMSPKLSAYILRSTPENIVERGVGGVCQRFLPSIEIHSVDSANR